MGQKDKVNLLHVIPVHSPHIKIEREGDCVTIAFPRFKRTWMAHLFLPKRMSADIRITLEEHGTSVFNLIDGQRTVGEIIEQLADSFNHEEGYDKRITTYLLQLQKDGLIRLLVGK